MAQRLGGAPGSFAGPVLQPYPSDAAPAHRHVERAYALDLLYVRVGLRQADVHPAVGQPRGAADHYLLVLHAAFHSLPGGLPGVEHVQQLHVGLAGELRLRHEAVLAQLPDPDLPHRLGPIPFHSSHSLGRVERPDCPGSRLLFHEQFSTNLRISLEIIRS